MRVLGIESSCDETAVAVVDADGRVEVSLLASQVAVHARYGGVVPEVASREHLRALDHLVAEALASAAGPLEAVAVTAGPGLVGALLVGIRYAAAFAWARGLPLVAVDHLEGHLVSPFLSLAGAPARALPERTLALVASGGHSAWYLVRPGEAPRRLCRTRDDAAGESFDKVAQVLGLPYPGGPWIDRLARAGRPTAVELPRPRVKDSDDFSFSGLKSAAIRHLRAAGLSGVGADDPSPTLCDLVASFERAVVDHLLAPLPGLVERHRPSLLTVSGGVAANTCLRGEMTAAGAAHAMPVLLPPPALCTDNAAMIARAGQLTAHRDGLHDPRRLDACLGEKWQPPGLARRRERGAAPLQEG
jgi:N6-L-threonylcarbamoyladenine synthase